MYTLPRRGGNEKNFLGMGLQVPAHRDFRPGRLLSLFGFIRSDGRLVLPELTSNMQKALDSYSNFMTGRNWNRDSQILLETMAESFIDHLAEKGRTLSQVTPQIASDYLEYRAQLCSDFPRIENHCMCLIWFLEFLQENGFIDEDHDFDSIGRRWKENREEENVHFLYRRPGFYKGPRKFGLYFGTLEELAEKDRMAKAGASRKRRKKKPKLKIVKEDSEEN